MQSIRHLKNSKKIKSILNLISILENRVDILLVRLGYFKLVNSARHAIESGFVFINLKLCLRINYEVKQYDSIHVCFKNLREAYIFI